MAIEDIFARTRARKGFAQDVIALQQFMQSQRQIAGPNVPMPMPFPTPRSTAGAELFSNFLLQRQQLQGRQTAQPGFTLGPGQQRFGPAGQPIARMPAAPITGFKVVNQLVDDPNSPTKFSVEQFNQAGQSIGRRFATRKEVLQGVPEAAVTKPTATKIEKDVIDLQSTLRELEAVEQQFDPDFFTFRGKGKAFFAALAEKAEIPIGRAHTQFLKDRSKFFADSKRIFLKFRKFITGVAGGIEEFREIAKATIDPESDSPTQFRAKFESMRDNAIRTSNLLLAIRNSGLELSKTNIKSALSVTPLGNIPLQVSPNVNLQTLNIQQTDTTQTGAIDPNKIDALGKRFGF